MSENKQCKKQFELKALAKNKKCKLFKNKTHIGFYT